MNEAVNKAKKEEKKRSNEVHQAAMKKLESEHRDDKKELKELRKALKDSELALKEAEARHAASSASNASSSAEKKKNGNHDASVKKMQELLSRSHFTT